jgi:DNA-directed RNA polymerase subunit F
MASDILGLFTNPQQYLAQQDASMQQQFAQRAALDPLQRASILGQQAGYRLGQGVGGALGGTDPQLEMISRRNALLGQLDPGDPTSYMKVAEAAAQMGDAQFAIAIAQEGRKAQSEINLAQQRGAEKMTNEQRNALEYASQFGTPDTQAFKDAFKERFDQLTLKAGKENKPFEFEAKEARLQELKSALRVLRNQPTQNKEAIQRLEDSIQAIEGPEKPEKYSDFARKLIEFGLTPGTEPFQKRMLEHINAVTKGASQGTGNVTIGGISVDIGEANKAAAKVIGTNAANIQNQFTLEKTIKGAVDLIDKGIYAGAYGPEKGAFAKYSLGVVGNKQKVENTEVFMSYIGETVIPRLQEFGGNDSNEELAYLQKVMGGNLRLEPESMRKILLSAEKKVQANIKRLQKQLEGGQLPTQPMDVPTPSAPRATKRANLKTGKLEDISGD